MLNRAEIASFLTHFRSVQHILRLTAYPLFSSNSKISTYFCNKRLEVLVSIYRDVNLRELQFIKLNTDTNMKKIILSMVMLMATCLAFAQDASYLIKQYRKADGAKYENMTKEVKKKAKKEKYIDPKMFDLTERLIKVEYVQVSLDDQQKEALTENIKNVDGYKQLYEKKSNVNNMLSENWTLFPIQQYYGIEQDGRVSDAIIRLETFLENKSTSMIIHVAGDFTVEELLQILSVEETKSIEFKSAE